MSTKAEAEDVSQEPQQVSPDARHTEGQLPQFFIPLNIAFYVLIVSHFLSAAYAPIQDCDETFNYWEPLHYLDHNYGLETWEYSPDFSIRSWAYVGLHALPAKLVSFLGLTKTTEFYVVRFLLGSVAAGTEVRLYSAICRKMNPRIGVIYLLIAAFSPGFFYASTAFLPSSFAMYTSTLGLTTFMDRRGGLNSAQGIMWFGIGALLGWPFSAALIVPFVVEEWVLALMGNDFSRTFRRYLDGATRCLAVLAVQVMVDTFFYRKLAIVPWRIVAYNVFGGKDRGPDIFGTEPWHFYARNLLLNFNLWFILAIGASPLFLLHILFRAQQETKQTLLRTLTFISPFYVWLAIFTLQPHKEERFMFPAYPFLALNAAIALHMILAYLGTTTPNTIVSRIPVTMRLVSTAVPVLIAVNIGVLRIIGTVTSYEAPLHIYKALERPGMTSPSTTVCFGKDWYRFPTSHFLPNGTHAKFIKSQFDGLLPGEFNETTTGSGLPATWIIPTGMNDRNEEDSSKHTAIEHCTYLVDTYWPGSEPSPLEPFYTMDEKWERVACAPLLDASQTHIIPRTIWIPDLPFIPSRYRRVWGEHCLLRQRVDSSYTEDSDW